MLKTLALAQKISLRTFTDGLLKLQMVINAGDEDSQLFVEYYIVASCDED
jgi:hypothetical protein